jgi:hypothetical protein
MDGCVPITKTTRFRFHSCLKAAGTDSAELLGRFFFNVINRVCFDLKRDKVCAEYNWW